MSEFEYINGDLFNEKIRTPMFDSKTRDLLLNASHYDWSKVSPAIFGNLFQSVMDNAQRRSEGAHYTSEHNILKVIKPLFLDALKEEFLRIKERKDGSRKRDLKKFQKKLGKLNFFDPACGSGNFLIISYREIRRLELDVLLELHDERIKRLDSSLLPIVNVNQFYGIEKDEFPARIARVALWMMDHIMNKELGDRFGETYSRIPLTKSPNIWINDALEINWHKILPSSKCSYMFGNPPFIGSSLMNNTQKMQIRKITHSHKCEGGGILDYVACWFLKAAEYANNQTVISFVSTNSITQGEQVAPLWSTILYKYNMHINFAYRSVLWYAKTKGMAHVTFVIVGFSKTADKKKRLFYREDGRYIEEKPRSKYILPYLIGVNKHLPLVHESKKSLNNLPEMKMGSKTVDGKNYIFTESEKLDFLKKEPNAKHLLRPYLNAKDYIHGSTRWILALHNIEPHKLTTLPEIMKRVSAVKNFRLQSKKPATKRLAEKPLLYEQNVLPNKPFLVIPETSSENRKYVPIGYLKPPIIPSNAMRIIENANISLFGLLTSSMHMTWLKIIGGRLDQRYRYSENMVYNTFPLPNKNINILEKFAQIILDVRKQYPNSSLNDLYNNTAMPPTLINAHNVLDHAVDRLYRKEKFENEHDRIEFLLEKYQEMISNQNLDKYRKKIRRKTS